MKVLLISEQEWSIGHGPFQIMAGNGTTFERVALSPLRPSGGSPLQRKLRRYFPGSPVTGAIRDAVAAFGPDIIHLDGRRSTALAAVAALRGKKWPPMLLEHGAMGGMNLLSPFDWLTYFNSRIDRLVVPSHAMLDHWNGRRMLSRAIGIERCSVLPLSVSMPPLVDQDARMALRDRLGLRQGKTVIGTVCNIRAIKNLPFVAEIVQSLGPDFVFAVAGQVLDAREAERVRQAGGASVHLLGPIPDAQSMMSAFDIYVTPTKLGGEGFGLAQVEAMSNGVPVLAMNFGGAAETLDHGLTGFALPADRSHWRDAILRLAADPALRRRMGLYARERAAVRFSAEAAAREWTLLYRLTVAAARASGRDRGQPQAN